ncbi:hypothetical protein D9613_013017 [Agrocybe pediades]|uniref:Uncharacterized protein n=1 Tax=Agrocybe pediades TaxID=84607 RepID=A0A8H4QPT7_9AGAR|nr:hypothetical protein D9613_002429 [Agrocybe pediades]KAF4615572.1 hypothetical protein D9613_013017 [Agrocybe pediades]
MVLKRKRGNEFVPFVPSSSQAEAAQPEPEREPEPKKPRSNPARNARPQSYNEDAPARSAAPVPPPPPATAPPAKKPRAPRGKKATTVSAPATAPQAGPSTAPAPEPTPAPAKKGRGKKKADPNAEEPEKRLAQFKPRCPQNILDRVQRVMTQRIFMIDRQREGDELREQFSILGSTGNVYTVTIDKLPRCNCPDSVKGNHCKHILFVFLKVLQVSQASGFWYQKALLTSELQQIFANAPLAPNSVAHAHVREAYARATGKIPANAPSTSAEEAKKNRRIPGPDDDCPICYDGMHGTAETALVFCEECGNALHKECFQQWQRTAKSSGKELTCVWCRAKWVVAGAAGAGTPVATRTLGNYGYLNLAGASGASPVRDTSTYYHGPRRGQRYYGYQNYDDY